MDTPASHSTSAPPGDDLSAAVKQVQLPPFSTIDAPTWFRRAEVQFRLKRVTNATTRADHVLAALPDEIFPRISEWLECNGDDAIEYADLKAYLLQRFTPSPATRVTQLLQLAQQPLGDQKPSDAFREMRAMARLTPAADGTPRQLDLLRALWLLRLPESIRAAIPNAEEIDEDDLQVKADHLADALTASSRRIHAVPPDTFLPSQDNDDVAAVQRPPLRARQSLPQKHDPLPRSKQRLGAPKTYFTDQLCFYHARFGSKARNCQPGCSWPKNE